MEIETPPHSPPTTPPSSEEIIIDTESIEDASCEEESMKKEQPSKKKSKKAKKKESAKKKTTTTTDNKENKENKEDKKKTPQPQQQAQQLQQPAPIQPLTPLVQPTPNNKKEVEFSILPVNIANLSIGDVNIKFRNEMTMSGDEIGFTVEVGGIGSSEAVETLEKEVAIAKKELKAWEEKLQQVKLRNGVF
jgi:hypothetical protein